jgi:rfaE bifunctional protein kinase chain/domain
VSTTTARLEACVRGFLSRRVVVLGDFVVDEFLHGDIARVSREAPVLVLEHRHTEAVLGGGGNSVANLHALGARPVPVGVIGDDAAGKHLLAALRERRIDASHVVVVRGYATPCKTRVLAGGIHTRRQQIVRIDRGSPRGRLAATIERRLSVALGRALRSAEGLLVADYGYGSASPAILDHVLGPLRRRELVVTVDSRARVERYRGVTACTPNQEELENALHTGPLDDATVAAAGQELRRRTNARAVLVTRGARGMVLVERGRPPLAVPAWGSEVADVTGAGDTVIAAFTVACIAGGSLSDASRLANYAAGLVVAKPGTATTTRAEILDAVYQDRPV